MKLEPTFGHTLDGAGRDAMIDRLRATPHAFVAQEWVRLSQAPTWSTEKQQFEPRVVGLRLYATANGDGYDVMPGGLARVAPESTAEVITMQRGGSSKDVWVLGDGATPWQSLLVPRLGRPRHRPRRFLFALARRGKSVLDGALRRARRQRRSLAALPSPSA